MPEYFMFLQRTQALVISQREFCQLRQTYIMQTTQIPPNCNGFVHEDANAARLSLLLQLNSVLGVHCNNRSDVTITAVSAWTRSQYRPRNSFMFYYHFCCRLSSSFFKIYIRQICIYRNSSVTSSSSSSSTSLRCSANLGSLVLPTIACLLAAISLLYCLSATSFCFAQRSTICWAVCPCFDLCSPRILCCCTRRPATIIISKSALKASDAASQMNAGKRNASYVCCGSVSYSLHVCPNRSS